MEEEGFWEEDILDSIRSGRFDVVDFDDGGDTTASLPMGFDGQLAGGGDSDEIVENAIGDILIEDAFVAEFLEIEFEAFELNAQTIGDVAEDECAEIGLTGFGADRSELGAFDLDGVIPLREGVFEALELVLEWGRQGESPGRERVVKR